MRRQTLAQLAASFWAIVAPLGCSPSTPIFLRDDGDMSHYRGFATQIEYPDVNSSLLDDVKQAEPPLTLSNTEPREVWDLTLQEAVKMAVTNSKVMRSLGAQAFVPTTFAGGTRFGDPTRLISTPTVVPSAYAPSIVESDPRLGVEGVLSQFDAQFTTSTFWYKNDYPQNFFIPGLQNPIFLQDQAINISQLSKRLATGGTVYVRNHNNYTLNNNNSNLYHDVYQPDIELEFAHPLLQGAGLQFNRIAGAVNVNNYSSPPIPGIYNGVAIARINHDIALADLEVGVRNLVDEVEATYWRLYFNYRDLDAQRVGRDSALITWRKIHALFQEGARGGEAEKEAQARQQYFQFRAQVEASLSDLYTSENQLRYIMGIATTDGRLIRPSDEPTTAHVQFEWYEILAEGLGRSAELRQQKWRIKQHELQLIAAKNFLMPQLNLDALYRFRGMGSNLLNNQLSSPNMQNGGILPYNSAYGSLLTGAFQEWQMGFSFYMPLGFRQGMAAVRNEQLQLARERSVLQDQELELSHQLANAVRSLDRFYALSQTNFNRRVAAEKEVTAVRAAYETGTVTLDLLLQAQQRLADAESAYYDVLSLYNLSIAQVHLRKGSLLEYNGVYLAEGPWADKAYFDARKRARERDAGMFINYGFTRPNVFSRGPIMQNAPTDVGDDKTSAAPMVPLIPIEGEAVPTPAATTPAAEPVPSFNPS
ncbi:MAG TPA: TolC family protein [Pirellulales bacterium]|jgi:outer membrane protein TolC|nr:TolC family protein [Pirellulales bacterium]